MITIAITVKQVAGYAILIAAFGYFICYLLSLWTYKNQLKQLHDGKPKAYYPHLVKPTLFSLSKSSKNENQPAKKRNPLDRRGR